MKAESDEKASSQESETKENSNPVKGQHWRGLQKDAVANRTTFREEEARASIKSLTDVRPFN